MAGSIVTAAANWCSRSTATKLNSLSRLRVVLSQLGQLGQDVGTKGSWSLATAAEVASSVPVWSYLLVLRRMIEATLSFLWTISLTRSISISIMVRRSYIVKAQSGHCGC